MFLHGLPPGSLTSYLHWGVLLSFSGCGDMDSKLLKDYERLKALYEVTNLLHSTLDNTQIFELIVHESVRLLRASSGSVVLLNPTTGLLEIEASAGLSSSAA